MFMAMIELEFDPTHRDEALALLRERASEARALPGNVRYEYLLDGEQPERKVRLLHMWRDEACMTQYMGSETFRALGAGLRALVSAPPVSHRFDVTARQRVDG